jgi:hypothetical protein
MTGRTVLFGAKKSAGHKPALEKEQKEKSFSLKD